MFYKPPWLPPLGVLHALLLHFLYLVRSERLLIEQLFYNLSSRWFVGLRMDPRLSNHSTFSKNPHLFIHLTISHTFFDAVRR